MSIISPKRAATSVLTKNTRKSVVALTALCVNSAICGFGCGGGGTTSTTPPPVPTTATLVVVQGIASPPVSVSLDGQVLAQNLGYLTSTNPLIVHSGQHQLLVQDASGPLLDEGPLTADLTSGAHTTFVYYGWGAFGRAVDQLTDDTTPADGSKAKLRIADYASSIPGVDVYVVPFGSGPSGTPVLTNLGEAAQKATYQVLPPGNYDIYFTANGANGSPMTVFYHTGSFPLAANQNRTVYFLNLCPTTGSSCSLSGMYTAVTVADLN